MIIDKKDIYGKCKDEQQFKMLFIKNELKSTGADVFCIETEETVKGFPDVIHLCYDFAYKGNTAPYFYEFKISDSYGKIKFQPTQPAFYKAHPRMNVAVIALNKVSGKVHVISTYYLFDTENVYCLSDKATVNLNLAEEIKKDESLDN